eukprot:g12458.t1
MASLKAESVPEDAPVTPDTLCAIFYTSGTTGVPKGVPVTHRSFVITAVNYYVRMPVFPSKDLPGPPQHVTFSYLPTAHVFAHVIEILTLLNGWKIGYFSGSTARMISDAQALRPTFMCMVPRVASKIQSAIVNGINEKGGISKVMFNMALKRKCSAMLKAKPRSPLARGQSKMWDKLVFSKTAALLGGRMQHIASGAALLKPEDGRFIKAAFCCQMFIGYGSTETAALATGTMPWLCDFRSVGHLFRDSEARLVSYPALGYDATPSDGSNPKGELQLRGPTVFTEYYKDPEATAECFDDGWYRTGDMAELYPEGDIRLIGRAGRIIKLQQGEYVNLE